MELVVIVIVCGSPWVFGAAEPEHRFWLFICLGILLLLWAARMVVQWRVSWKPCPVMFCLAAVFLTGILQISSLPPSWLSRLAPAQARIYGQLLPNQQEVLQVVSPQVVSAHTQVGQTPSFYPEATRNWLVNLSAVFLLFVVVRNNLDSQGSLRRLSIATLVNGALLSLFGLVQFFATTEPGTIYWTYPTDGEVFGPFINSNHFAFYINICTGLAIGLLLTRRRASKTRRSRATERDNQWLVALRDLLHDPTALWVCGGMALMLSGVVLCLSRGGFLALLGATALCVVLGLRGGRSGRKIGALFLSFALALGLLLWFGLDPFIERMATLWTGEAYSLEGGRVFLLSRAWPVVRDFPLLGTGYGTFRFVEPVWFHTPSNVGAIYKHAHNDYLEDLVEGGIIRLGIRLVAIALVFRFALCALRNSKTSSTRAVALAVTFSFTTIVIHSFFEFGLHIPAIAALATVLVAHLGNMADDSDPAARETSEHSLVCFGLAPIGGAVLAVTLAWFLYTEGARDSAVESLRQEAQAMRELSMQGGFTRTREIPFLQDAVRLKPNDAESQFLLAEAFFGVSDEQNLSADSESAEARSLSEAATLGGLQHTIRARNLCPLLAAPHTRLAAHRDFLKQADPLATYLKRARFLAPMDSRLWFFCGVQELADGRREEATSNWRQSLELSDRQLTDILDRLAIFLGPNEILQMLPERPESLLKAALHLFPQADDADALQQPFLRKALTILENQQRPLDAMQWHTKAIIQRRLGQPSDAIVAYRSALAGDPLKLGWRYELALLLVEQKRIRAAQRELETILDQRPTHSSALRLLESTRRMQAERQHEQQHGVRS